jgi:hypothetical protein
MLLNDYGFQTAHQIPNIYGIQVRQSTSYLKPPRPLPLVDGPAETLELAQRAVQVLINGLRDLEGALDLPAVERLANRHAHPALIWNAALGFIRGRDDLAGQVSHVILEKNEIKLVSGPSPTVEWHRLKLARGVYDHFEGLDPVKINGRLDSRLVGQRHPVSMRPASDLADQAAIDERRGVAEPSVDPLWDAPDLPQSVTYQFARESRTIEADEAPAELHDFAVALAAVVRSRFPYRGALPRLRFVGWGHGSWRESAFSRNPPRAKRESAQRSGGERASAVRTKLIELVRQHLGKLDDDTESEIFVSPVIGEAASDHSLSDDAGRVVIVQVVDNAYGSAGRPTAGTPHGASATPPVTSTRRARGGPGASSRHYGQVGAQLDVNSAEDQDDQPGSLVSGATFGVDHGPLRRAEVPHGVKRHRDGEQEVVGEGVDAKRRRGVSGGSRPGLLQDELVSFMEDAVDTAAAGLVGRAPSSGLGNEVHSAERYEADPSESTALARRKFSHLFGSNSSQFDATGEGQLVNRVNVAVAAVEKLSDRRFVPNPEGEPSPGRLVERYFGERARVVGGPAEIVKRLVDLGDGAHGLVFIHPTGGPWHVVNVIRDQNNSVYFLDVYAQQLASLPVSASYLFLPVSKRGDDAPRILIDGDSAAATDNAVSAAVVSPDSVERVDALPVTPRPGSDLAAPLDPPAGDLYGGLGFEQELKHEIKFGDGVERYGKMVLAELPGLLKVVSKKASVFVTDEGKVFDTFREAATTAGVGGKVDRQQIYITELVSEPAGILGAGDTRIDANDEQDEMERILSAVEDARARLSGHDEHRPRNVFAPIEEIFPESAGYIISEYGRGIKIGGHDELPDDRRTRMHLTTGVPINGLWDYLRTAVIHDDLMPLGWLQDGLAVGEQIARLFVQQNVDRPMLEDFTYLLTTAIAEIDAIRGYIALVFTHAAAPLIRFRTPPGEPRALNKNYLSFASRTDIAEIRKMLPVEVQNFLESSSAQLTDIIEKALDSTIPAVDGDASSPLDYTITHDVRTLRDFVDSALLSEETLKVDGRTTISMHDAIGMFGVAPVPDTNGGRLEHGLILLESRHIVPGPTPAPTLRAITDDYVAWSRKANAWAGSAVVGGDNLAAMLQQVMDSDIVPKIGPLLEVVKSLSAEMATTELFNDPGGVVKLGVVQLATTGQLDERLADGIDKLVNLVDEELQWGELQQGPGDGVVEAITKARQLSNAIRVAELVRMLSTDDQQPELTSTSKLPNENTNEFGDEEASSAQESGESSESPDDRPIGAAIVPDAAGDLPAPVSYQFEPKQKRFPADGVDLAEMNDFALSLAGLAVTMTQNNSALPHVEVTGLGNGHPYYRDAGKSVGTERAEYVWFWLKDRVSLHLSSYGQSFAQHVVDVMFSQSEKDAWVRGRVWGGEWGVPAGREVTVRVLENDGLVSVAGDASAAIPARPPDRGQSDPGESQGDSGTADVSQGADQPEESGPQHEPAETAIIQPTVVYRFDLDKDTNVDPTPELEEFVLSLADTIRARLHSPRASRLPRVRVTDLGNPHVYGRNTTAHNGDGRAGAVRLWLMRRVGEHLDRNDPGGSLVRAVFLATSVRGQSRDQLTADGAGRVVTIELIDDASDGMAHQVARADSAERAKQRKDTAGQDRRSSGFLDGALGGVGGRQYRQHVVDPERVRRNVRSASEWRRGADQLPLGRDIYWEGSFAPNSLEEHAFLGSFDKLFELNPQRLTPSDSNYGRNCEAVAAAVAERLSGAAPPVELSQGPDISNALSHHFGEPIRRVNGPGEIVDLLDGMGADSHGIVFLRDTAQDGRPAERPGHVVNVFHHDGALVFLDVQNGKLASLPDEAEYHFLATSRTSHANTDVRFGQGSKTVLVTETDKLDLFVDKIARVVRDDPNGEFNVTVTVTGYGNAARPWIVQALGSGHQAIQSRAENTGNLRASAVADELKARIKVHRELASKDIPIQTESEGRLPGTADIDRRRADVVLNVVPKAKPVADGVSPDGAQDSDTESWHTANETKARSTLRTSADEIAQVLSGQSPTGDAPRSDAAQEGDIPDQNAPAGLTTVGNDTTDLVTPDMARTSTRTLSELPPRASAESGFAESDSDDDGQSTTYLSIDDEVSRNDAPHDVSASQNASAAAMAPFAEWQRPTVAGLDSGIGHSGAPGRGATVLPGSTGEGPTDGVDGDPTRRSTDQDALDADAQSSLDMAPQQGPDTESEYSLDASADGQSDTESGISDLSYFDAPGPNVLAQGSRQDEDADGEGTVADEIERALSSRVLTRAEESPEQDEHSPESHAAGPSAGLRAEDIPARSGNVAGAAHGDLAGTGSGTGHSDGAPDSTVTMLPGPIDEALTTGATAADANEQSPVTKANLAAPEVSAPHSEDASPTKPHEGTSDEAPAAPLTGLGLSVTSAKAGDQQPGPGDVVIDMTPVPAASAVSPAESSPIVDWGLRRDGVVGAVAVDPVQEEVIKALRDELGAAVRAIPGGNPLMSIGQDDLDKQLTTQLTEQWLATKLPYLRDEKGVSFKVTWRGCQHDVSLRLELSKPQLVPGAGNVADPPGQRPRFTQVHRTYATTGWQNMGSTNNYRTLPSFLTLPLPYGAKLASLVTTPELSYTHNQISTTDAVGGGMEADLFLRISENSVPYQYTMNWQFKIDPGEDANELDWSEAGTHGHVRALIPDHLADPVLPEDMDPVVSLDDIPLFQVDSVPHPSWLHDEVRKEFSAEFSGLSENSLEDIAKFFQEKSIRGHIRFILAGAYMTPQLFDKSDNVVGLLRLDAVIKDDSLQKELASNATAIEDYLGSTTFQSSSMTVTNALGVTIPTAAQPAGSPASGTVTVNPGLSKSKTDTLSAGGNTVLYRALRSSEPHLLTHTAVEYTVTLVRAGNSEKTVVLKTGPNGLNLRVMSRQMADGLTPDKLPMGYLSTGGHRHPDETITGLRSINLQIATNKVTGADPAFADAEKWLRDVGYLPSDVAESLTERIFSNQRRSAQLENYRRFTIARSSVQLKTAFADMIDGGASIWFDLPDVSSSRRVELRLYAKKTADLDYLRTVGGIQTESYTFLTEPGSQSSGSVWGASLEVAGKGSHQLGQLGSVSVTPIDYTYQQSRAVTKIESTGIQHEPMVFGGHSDLMDVFNAPLELQLGVYTENPDNAFHIFTWSGGKNWVPGSVELWIPPEFTRNAPASNSVAPALPTVELATDANAEEFTSGVRLPATTIFEKVGGSAELQTALLDTLMGRGYGENSTVSSVTPWSAVKQWLAGQDAWRPGSIVQQTSRIALSPAALLPYAHRLFNGTYAIEPSDGGLGANQEHQFSVRSSVHNPKLVPTVTYDKSGKEVDHGGGFVVYMETELGNIESSSAVRTTQNTHQFSLVLAATSKYPVEVTPTGQIAHYRQRGKVRINGTAVYMEGVNADTEISFRFTADVVHLLTVSRGVGNLVAGLIGRGSAPDTTARIFVPGGVQAVLSGHLVREYQGSLGKEAALLSLHHLPQLGEPRWLPERVRAGEGLGLVAITDVVPNNPGSAEPDRASQPQIVDRAHFLLETVKLINAHTPGVLMPGHSAYVKGLWSRITSATSQEAMRALPMNHPHGRILVPYTYVHAGGARKIELEFTAKPNEDHDKVQGNVLYHPNIDNTVSALESFASDARNVHGHSDVRTTGNTMTVSPSANNSKNIAGVFNNKTGPSMALTTSTLRSSGWTTTPRRREIVRGNENGTEFRINYLYSVRLTQIPLDPTPAGIPNRIGPAVADGVKWLRGAAPSNVAESSARLTLRFTTSETLPIVSGSKSAPQIPSRLAPVIHPADPFTNKPGPAPAAEVAVAVPGPAAPGVPVAGAVPEVGVAVASVVALAPAMAGAGAVATPTSRLPDRSAPDPRVVKLHGAINVQSYNGLELLEKVVGQVAPTLFPPGSRLSNSSNNFIVTLTHIVRSGRGALGNSGGEFGLHSGLSEEPAIQVEATVSGLRVVTSGLVNIDEALQFVTAWNSLLNSSFNPAFNLTESLGNNGEPQGGAIIGLANVTELLSGQTGTGSIVGRTDIRTQPNPERGDKSHEASADLVLKVVGPNGTRWVTGTMYLRLTELDVLGKGLLPAPEPFPGTFDVRSVIARPDRDQAATTDPETLGRDVVTYVRAEIDGHEATAPTPGHYPGIVSLWFDMHEPLPSTVNGDIPPLDPDRNRRMINALVSAWQDLDSSRPAVLALPGDSGVRLLLIGPDRVLSALDSDIPALGDLVNGPITPIAPVAARQNHDKAQNDQAVQNDPASTETPQPLASDSTSPALIRMHHGSGTGVTSDPGPSRQPLTTVGPVEDAPTIADDLGESDDSKEEELDPALKKRFSKLSTRAVHRLLIEANNLMLQAGFAPPAHIQTGLSEQEKAELHDREAILHEVAQRLHATRHDTETELLSAAELAKELREGSTLPRLAAPAGRARGSHSGSSGAPPTPGAGPSRQAGWDDFEWEPSASDLSELDDESLFGGGSDDGSEAFPAGQAEIPELGDALVANHHAGKASTNLPISRKRNQKPLMHADLQASNPEHKPEIIQLINDYLEARRSKRVFGTPSRTATMTYLRGDDTNYTPQKTVQGDPKWFMKIINEALKDLPAQRRERKPKVHADLQASNPEHKPEIIQLINDYLEARRSKGVFGTPSRAAIKTYLRGDDTEYTPRKTVGGQKVVISKIVNELLAQLPAHKQERKPRMHADLLASEPKHRTEIKRLIEAYVKTLNSNGEGTPVGEQVLRHLRGGDTEYPTPKTVQGETTVIMGIVHEALAGLPAPQMERKMHADLTAGEPEHRPEIKKLIEAYVRKRTRKGEGTPGQREILRHLRGGDTEYPTPKTVQGNSTVILEIAHEVLAKKNPRKRPESSPTRETGAADDVSPMNANQRRWTKRRRLASSPPAVPADEPLRGESPSDSDVDMSHVEGVSPQPHSARGGTPAGSQAMPAASGAEVVRPTTRRLDQGRFETTWPGELNGEEFRIVRSVQHRLDPDPKMDDAFPWRAPDSPVDKVYKPYAADDGSVHPGVLGRVDEITATMASSKAHLKEIARDSKDKRLPVTAVKALTKVWPQLEQAVAVEIRRLTRGEPHASFPVHPRKVTKEHVRPQELGLVGQWGLFLTKPLAEMSVDDWPSLRNGRILGVYLGIVLDDPDDLEQWIRNYTNFPSYAVELAPSDKRAISTMSGEGAANAIAFANTALERTSGPEGAATSGVNYDWDVINAEFVTFTIRIRDKNGRLRAQPIQALVALDNAFDSVTNPHGMIVVDYGQSYLPNFEGIIKQEPLDDGIAVVTSATQHAPETDPPPAAASEEH